MGCYVILVNGVDTPEGELVPALKQAVRKEVGPFATPDFIIITTALPTTRSGKIMRRLLRKILARSSLFRPQTCSVACPRCVPGWCVVKLLLWLIHDVNPLLADLRRQTRAPQSSWVTCQRSRTRRWCRSLSPRSKSCRHPRLLDGSRCLSTLRHS